MVQSNDYHLEGAGAASHALSVLETRFASAQSKLNPSRRKLVRMILENPEDTYYLSSRELAKRYQVDAATIVSPTSAPTSSRASLPTPF